MRNSAGLVGHQFMKNWPLALVKYALAAIK
jgi:hypothetical protein